MSIVIRKHIFESIVLGEASVLVALRQIEKTKLGSVVVVNLDGMLIGTLADGDFRRWLMSHEASNLDFSCELVANTKCRSLPMGSSSHDIERLMTNGIRVLPLLDDRGRVVAIAIKRTRELEIEHFLISENQPTFIIAEVGINHNGSFEVAKQLVNAAAHAKANCVKFQLRDFESLYRLSSDSKLGSEDLGAEYTKDLIKDSFLESSQIFDLMKYSRDLGLIPICTAWDIRSAELLMEFGVGAFKIASADLTNHTLIQTVIEANVPLILSTGMSTETEISETASLLKDSMVPFAMLHCQSVYPPSFKDLNLRYMSRLADIGDSVMGYSSHERGFHVAVAAVAMGARIIEKHITLDKGARGVDHVVSLEPTEFSEMVRNIRTLEESFGSNAPRNLTQGEKLNRLSLSKSLVANRDLAVGQIISDKDVTIKGPGRGVQPNRLPDLIGKMLTRDMCEGDFFFETDILGVVEAKREFTFSRPWGLPVRFHDWTELLEGTNPDFLEFHLSFRDMSLAVDEIVPIKVDLGLVVHSPDLFQGDHILDLASLDDTVWHKSISELQRVIDLTNLLAKKFSSKNPPLVVASLGGSSVDKPLPISERPQLYERVGNAISQLSCGDAVLLAQTLPPFPWYLGGQRYCNLFVDPEETAKFSDQFGVALCLDVSHTKLSCNFLGKSFSSAVEILAPRSKHFHLVDAAGVDDEGLQIGDGEIDWPHLLNQLAGLAPGVGFIPEIWQGHVDDGRGFWSALSKLEAFENLTQRAR